MSPFYRVPMLYEAMMLSLYRGHYGDRYRTIAEWIPGGASVLDLCSGPGRLYTRWLRQRGVRYTGLDLSESFVAHLRAQGAAAEVWDLSDPRPLPAADVVVMQGGLCHFLPDVAPVLRRMLTAARELVIVSEPVRSVMHGGNALLSAIARYVTDPGNGQSRFRFSEEDLRASITPHRAQIQASFLIPGGRERVYVLRPDAALKPEGIDFSRTS